MRSEGGTLPPAAVVSIGLTWAIAPRFGERSWGTIVLSGVIGAAMAMFLVVPGIYGWEAEEEGSDRSVRMSTKKRAVMVTIGVLVVVANGLLSPLFAGHVNAD